MLTLCQNVLYGVYVVDSCLINLFCNDCLRPLAILVLLGKVSTLGLLHMVSGGCCDNT